MTAVVTAFLRNRDDVLLLRRSDAVGSYRDRWGAVSGHVDPDPGTSEDPDRTPEAAVRAEIEEEAGLLDACELVRAGDPFEVVDDDRGRTWRVHPFLFDCASRAVFTDEETVETAWVPPTGIHRRKTVPDLWRSYDRVRPTVGTVREDAEHGSAYLSVRALDVLRDRAGELAADGPAVGEAAVEVAGESATGVAGATDEGADARTELAALARDLLAARPGMAAVRNRVNRAMARAVERTAEARTSAETVEECARAAIEAALAADGRAAERAADLLAGERVLTLSRSGTVLRALRDHPERVLVAESRPGGEGVGVAEDLAEADLDVTLVPDAAVAHYLAAGEVDAVLVGADTVLADGRVVNKVGTRAAARENVPLYAVAARDKVAPGEEPDLEDADPRDVYDGDAPLSVAASLFDVTPADLVAGVVTEDGVLDADDVASVAEEHRALTGWQEST